MALQRGAPVAQHGDERLGVLLRQPQLLQLKRQCLLRHGVPRGAREDEVERRDDSLDLGRIELAIADELGELRLVGGLTARLLEHELGEQLELDDRQLRDDKHLRQELRAAEGGASAERAQHTREQSRSGARTQSGTSSPPTNWKRMVLEQEVAAARPAARTAPLARARVAECHTPSLLVRGERSLTRARGLAELDNFLSNLLSFCDVIFVVSANGCETEEDKMTPLLLLVASTSVAPLLASRSAMATRTSPVWMNSGCEPQLIRVTLTKPLGCAFEEVEADRPSGVLVHEVLPGGSAEASAKVWPGDLLLQIGEVDVHAASFDRVMEHLLEGGQLELVLQRLPGRVARITFPNGVAAFGGAGEKLSTLAKRAQFRPLYKCGEGLCASCELVLRSAAKGDEGTGREHSREKPVRICNGRVPQVGGEFELAWPDGAGPDGWVR